MYVTIIIKLQKKHKTYQTWINNECKDLQGRAWGSRVDIRCFRPHVQLHRYTCLPFRHSWHGLLECTCPCSTEHKRQPSFHKQSNAIDFIAFTKKKSPSVLVLPESYLVVSIDALELTSLRLAAGTPSVWTMTSSSSSPDMYVSGMY